MEEETDSGFCFVFVFLSEAPVLAVKRETFQTRRPSAVFGERQVFLFAEKKESSSSLSVAVGRPLASVFKKCPPPTKLMLAAFFPETWQK